MSKMLTFRPRSSSRSLPARMQAAWRSFWRGPLSIKDAALAKFFGSGYDSAAGVKVTAENAFTFSAVFDAVNQIASDVAKLPLNLRKRRDDGGSDPYDASTLYMLLKLQPNPEMGSMVFRRTLLAHALTCHGGYAEIQRDNSGRPRALWILTPDRVEPFRQRNANGELGPLRYRIDGRDDNILEDANVLHITGLGYDGYIGYSVIDKARQTIGLALAAESFGAKYFGKGTVFGGWLETEDDLDEDQKVEIRENIETFRAAQDSAWRILVTGSGHKFHQFDSKPRDSQMDESRVRQVEEVARFFRMPPFKLGVNTPGTVSYASVEQANLDYYTGCLLDWITLIEQEFQRKLIPALEWRQQFIKHNVNGFLRGSIKDRYDALAVAYDRGVINADDWLELEDMNPQPKGQGKIYLANGAMVPKDLLVELTQSKIDEAQAKTKAASQPPAPQPPPAPEPTRDAKALALLEDVRQAAEAARQQLAALEASGTAQLAELAQLRDQAARLETLETQTGVIVEFVRDRSAVLTAAAETAQSEARDLAAQRVAMAAALAAAERDLEAARADLAQAAGSTETERAARALAEGQLADAEARVAEGAGLLASVEAKIAELSAASEAERQARAAAERDLEAARAQAGRLEMASAATAQTVGALEASAAALRATLAQAESSASANAAELASVRAVMAELERDLAEARAGAEALRTQLAQAQQAADERAIELASTIASQARTEKSDRLATLTAHRGLFVDAAGRMTRREAEQARKRMATQEKLRRWLAEFPTLHEALCVEAMLPAVRTRLAWQRSDEDPRTVTQALVREHLVLFDRQLRAALEADPQEFHAVLDRILTKWETERPEALADALLLEDMRHVAA